MEIGSQGKPQIINRRSVRDRRTHSDPGYMGLEKRVHGERRRLPDKRTFSRYGVKGVIFTRLRSENEEEEGLGEVMDIGRGGLAIRYFVRSDINEDYSNLDMFLSGDNFMINMIPIKKVSDIELPNKTPFSTISMRRYGLKFEELTADQSSKLGYYIKYHIQGDA
jgi:hypothetical protein